MSEFASTGASASTASAVSTVSAPGKALIAGGYLVLEHPNVGVTIASTSRFYSTVQCLPYDDHNCSGSRSSDVLNILVDSPQFRSKFTYQYSISDNKLSLTSERGNDFVEKCLSLVLSFCKKALGTEAFESRVKCIANSTTTGTSASSTYSQLGIKLRADNDFYSQIKELKSRNLSRLSSSLNQLERFIACPINAETGALEVSKTGMGSSAALTTSLVGSLLHFFNVVDDQLASDESKRVIHNLSQLAHAIAQGKIGSGFDVAAAVYGTQLYRRFSPDGFASCMEANADYHLIYQSIMNQSLWTQTIQSFSLPLHMDIIMGDVCGGSSSTSMAKEVLKWRKDKPESASIIWDSLSTVNVDIYECFESIKLFQANNIDEYTSTMLWASGKISSEWITYNNNKDHSLMSQLLLLHSLFKQARKFLKHMGFESGVGIEPDEQTLLADATEEIPGVLVAGVPGAGGVDAIFAIVLSVTAKDAVEAMWSKWEVDGAVVCPLLLHASKDGIRVEDLQW